MEARRDDVAQVTGQTSFEIHHSVNFAPLNKHVVTNILEGKCMP